MHSIRISSFGFGWSAMVRHLHKNAVNTSNVEQWRRCSGAKPRIADMLAAPKKNERWVFLVSGTLSVVSSTSWSYSWWEQVTWGGFLAINMCLSQTGWIEGVCAPRTISHMADKNWFKPVASLMVWFRRRAKTIPPHLRRVTCRFIQANHLLVSSIPQGTR